MTHFRTHSKQTPPYPSPKICLSLSSENSSLNTETLPETFICSSLRYVPDRRPLLSVNLSRPLFCPVSLTSFIFSDSPSSAVESTGFWWLPLFFFCRHGEETSEWSSGHIGSVVRTSSCLSLCHGDFCPH